MFVFVTPKKLHSVLDTLMLASPRAYHATVAIENKIYMLGGFDGTGDYSNYYNSTVFFDAILGKWFPSAPMHERRCYISVVKVDAKIYALGGSNGYKRLNTVESLCPATNLWSMVSPMCMQRSDAGATQLNVRFLWLCVINLIY